MPSALIEAVDAGAVITAPLLELVTLAVVHGVVFDTDPIDLILGVRAIILARLETTVESIVLFSALAFCVDAVTVKGTVVLFLGIDGVDIDIDK